MSCFFVWVEGMQKWAIPVGVEVGGASTGDDVGEPVVAFQLDSGLTQYQRFGTRFVQAGLMDGLMASKRGMAIVLFRATFSQMSPGWTW